MQKHFSLLTISLLVCFLFGMSETIAQEPLSFDQALEQTLSHNYGIQMATIDTEVAANSASKTNAGYLPTLSATGGYNWDYVTGSNTLRTETIDFEPNNAYNYNAGVTVNYVLFNGQGRRFNYLALQEAEALSEVQLRQLVENTVLELSQVFYEAARLKEAAEALEETLLISKDRLKRAQYGYEYGQNTQLEVLNAEVDLNTDSINLINTRQTLENTLRNLQLIMGQPLDELREPVAETLDFSLLFTKDELVDKALVNNARIESMEHNVRSAEYALGSARARWLPTLSAQGAYNYRGSDNPNGAFLIGNEAFGPTAGLNLSWNLFDGSTKVAIDNAKLQYQNAEVNQELTQETVKRDVLNAYGSYRNAVFALDAQEINVTTAQRNFERSQEAFNLGQITNVEFRTAQLNLLNAQLRLTQFRNEAENAQLQVLALCGELLR